MTKYKILLVAGGILNTLFLFFHILLGYRISQLSGLAYPQRSLMEALNLGGMLFLFFFAYASFFLGKELLGTRLGRTVLALAAVLYLSRAGEEFVLFKFTAVVFGACMLVGIIYLALLVSAMNESRAGSIQGKVSLDDQQKLGRAA